MPTYYNVYEGFNNGIFNKKYKKIYLENVNASIIIEKEKKDDLNDDIILDYYDYDYMCDLI
jgi:hypothetical protein